MISFGNSPRHQVNETTIFSDGKKIAKNGIRFVVVGK